MHILGEMDKALTAPRAELGEYAPRIETMQIPTDKIREVIGSGGKVIREIVEKTGAKINIEDDGTIKIASADAKSIKAAYNWIRSIVAEPELGTIYEGTVVKVVEFGAFVNFFGSQRRPRPHLPARQEPRQQGHGRGQGRRQGQGQVPRHGRTRQGPPVHEGRRPGDRRGHHREAESRARSREDPGRGGVDFPLDTRSYHQGAVQTAPFPYAVTPVTSLKPG